MRLLDIATAVLVTGLAAAAFHASASLAEEQATRSVTGALDASAPGRLRAVSSVSATPRRLRQVDVVAERFEFQPDRIEVEQGEHVKVTVRSADGTHGFEIRGLGVHTKVPRDGEPVTVEFDADRAGTFEIKCFEYCGTGHRQMKATLVVNPVRPGE